MLAMKSAAIVSFACLVMLASEVAAFSVHTPTPSVRHRGNIILKRQQQQRVQPKLSNDNNSNMPPIIKNILQQQELNDDNVAMLVDPPSNNDAMTSAKETATTNAINGDTTTTDTKQLAVIDSSTINGESTDSVVQQQQEEKELTETQKLMQQVKDAGLAGVISYAFWEILFWAVSVPVCVFGYRELTGHWPDFTNAEDMQKLGAEAFAFVNFTRFAVPLRIGLALGTTPWIEENIVEKYFKKNEK